MVQKGCNIRWLNTTEIIIEGHLDEYADLSELSAAAGTVLSVDLSEVLKMNSSGIRTWVQTIMRLRIQLRLKRCAPIVVEQFSMIPEFMGKNGYVESFFGYFVCNGCTQEEQKLFIVGRDVFPGQSYSAHEREEICPNCSENMEFDHNSDIYFSFLKSIRPPLPQVS